MTTFLAPRAALTLPFERAGLDLERVGDVDVRFFAFRPRGLELVFDEDEDGDEGWRLRWDGFDMEIEAEGEVKPRCIDDYLALADVEDKPQKSLEFVELWGLPNLGDDDLGRDLGDTDKRSFVWLSDIQAQAAHLSRLLLAFLATEEDRFLSNDDLIALGAHDYGSWSWFRLPEEEMEWKRLEEERRRLFEEELTTARDAGPPFRMGRAEIENFHERLNADARSHWLRWRDRDRERGNLRYQRALIAHLVTTFSAPMSFPTAGWDFEGRKLLTEVLGADALVGEELRQIFQAPQLDVYACSVCGRPFVFDERTGKRRPRRGAGRFCSEEHRAEAKRRSNQASWHRNKKEWRR